MSEVLKMARTLFEKIIDREIPSQIVYEDDVVLAFKDINPQAPIHVLVIPKVKVERFSQLQKQDPAWIGSWIGKIAHVASLLGLDGDGYRVVINNGDDGGQTVEYIHAHILGGRPLAWPPG
jgi:histidine triad (HIT) family protein